jgi:hypothetical protein
MAATFGRGGGAEKGGVHLKDSGTFTGSMSTAVS